MPQLRPKYSVRVETTVIDSGDELGVSFRLVPDVEVFERDSAAFARGQHVGATLVAPMSIPAVEALPVRQHAVVVRNAQTRELVTSIEILSPANKVGAEHDRLMEKRRRLRREGVHLVDIDLLRGGRRVVEDVRLPDSAYLVSLLRAESVRIELWPLALAEALPQIPIPVLTEDPDAILDLARAVRDKYESADFEGDIDYRQPLPPPPLSRENDAWVRALLDAYLASATA